MLKSNTQTRSGPIRYIWGRGEEIPAHLELDFFCYRRPAPYPGPGTCRRGGLLGAQARRAFGRVVVRKEGNEKYLRVIEPLRKLTVRMLYGAMNALGHALIRHSMSIWRCAQLSRFPFTGTVTMCYISLIAKNGESSSMIRSTLSTPNIIRAGNRSIFSRMRVFGKSGPSTGTATVGRLWGSVPDLASKFLLHSLKGGESFAS